MAEPFQALPSPGPWKKFFSSGDDITLTSCNIVTTKSYFECRRYFSRPGNIVTLICFLKNSRDSYEAIDTSHESLRPFLTVLGIKKGIHQIFKKLVILKVNVFCFFSIFSRYFYMIIEFEPIFNIFLKKNTKIVIFVFFFKISRLRWRYLRYLHHTMTRKISSQNYLNGAKYRHGAITT
jgi:hypothetical protein